MMYWGIRYVNVWAWVAYMCEDYGLPRTGIQDLMCACGRTHIPGLKPRLPEIGLDVDSGLQSTCRGERGRLCAVYCVASLSVER